MDGRKLGVSASDPGGEALKKSQTSIFGHYAEISLDRGATV
jgi:hypothetical protein